MLRKRDRAFVPLLGYEASVIIGQMVKKLRLSAFLFEKKKLLSRPIK